MKKLILLICLSAFFSNVFAQYSKLFDFEYTPKGSNPFGDLYFDGTFLYGLTNEGGINDDGIFFKIKIDGTGFVNLFDFNSSITGSAPNASLIFDGTFFYGTCSYGGPGSKGTVFKIKPDGTGFVDILDFLGNPNGGYPKCTLYSDGTYLYGTTEQGGTANNGIIFKIKPDGTGYAKLLDFTGTANGSTPSGTLIYNGTFLYGTTQSGGANNKGTIFKIKTDGTGYSDVYDLVGSSTGSNIYGSLIFDGTYFYGMARNGGTNNFGTIFKIKPDGSSFSVMLQFADTLNGANPSGSLLFDGTYMYGVTGYGGINHYGTIFKIKTDGTGYSKLYEFSGPNGKYPYGSLISVSGVLYGLAENGGPTSDGVIFKYDLGKTGIDNENQKIDVTIFPSPAFGKIWIKNTGTPNSKYRLEIYNMLGDLIYAEPEYYCGNSNPIDLSNYKSGIYLIKLFNGKDCISKKIILEN